MTTCHMPMGCEVRISNFCVCHIIEDITICQKLVHIRSHHHHEVQRWHVNTNANFNLDTLCHSGCPCQNNAKNLERSKWCWFSLIILMVSSVHNKVSWGQTVNAEYYQKFLEDYLNLATQESSAFHHRYSTSCGTWKSTLSCAKTC
jgi:hypothetical protein